EPTKTEPVKADPSENPTTSATDNPQETDAMVQSTDFATVQPTLPPAKAYLKIQVGNAVYDPIPLVVDDQLTIKQPNGYENVAEVTAESVKMLSANCDNQDCVNQGTVTLANRGSRVLQNMIICLPNHVVLELLTPEEAQLAWESNYRD
ncbi:MAG: NusG domain II-containing protein, partial [Eubacteriales bacterium]|nr:NusG domain II-containing protein [Eubacteriales bacterium]